MSAHAKWVRNNLVMHRRDNHKSWFDAYGINVSKFIENFNITSLVVSSTVSENASIGGWHWTNVRTGGTASIARSEAILGGAIRVTTATSDTDGINVQVSGRAFQPVADNPLYFGIRMRFVTEANTVAWRAGLFPTSGTVIATPPDQGIFFDKPTAGVVLNYVLRNAGAQTSTAFGNVAADTWYNMEFFFDGTNVDFYVNGVQGTRPVITNLPATTLLTPTFALRTGADAARICDIAWIRAIQIQN